LFSQGAQIYIYIYIYIYINPQSQKRKWYAVRGKRVGPSGECLVRSTALYVYIYIYKYIYIYMNIKFYYYNIYMIIKLMFNQGA
jgi:hypothetical protein